MSINQKAADLALRELDKLRQFILSGEVTFVVAYGTKDGEAYHFGGTTDENRPPESILKLATVFDGLAADLRRDRRRERSSIILIDGIPR